MPLTSRDAVDRFLACKRIAFIGVSRNATDFSRQVLQQLTLHGYDVVPVHPEAKIIEGRRCHSDVRNIDPPVEGALIMTPSTVSALVVQGCLEAGIKRIWFHRAIGPGAVSEPALALCRKAGIEVVAGECPLMYLCGSKFPHNFHRWLRSLTFIGHESTVG